MGGPQPLSRPNDAVVNEKIDGDYQANDSDRTLSDAENGTTTGDGRQQQQQQLRQPPAHPTVAFWHAELAKVRREVASRWLVMILILVTFIMAILSLFWGVQFRALQNMHNLKIYVVDFDGQADPYTSTSPFVGPLVVKIAEELAAGPAALGYTVVPASHFNHDPMAVRKAVYDWDCWAAIYVNPNATALLEEAVATGNSSYNPYGSMQMILQSARDYTTFTSYIFTGFDEFSQLFSARFGPMWTERLASNSSLSLRDLASASAAVNPGIEPLSLDLRPFLPVTATPAVSIGLIYLIILAFFSFSFFMPIHMRYVMPGMGHRPMHFSHLIVWRLCATITAYFIISLAYSLVSLGFQIPFTRPPVSHVEPAPPSGATAYGRGSFPVYWMLNWVGMCALGLACENMAMILGMPWTALWLIFWVITNVATGFYALETTPGFYKWGRAWPLHQIVEASKHILFDLHSRIGINFGILFAWIAVGIALFPFCCWFMRWKDIRARRQNQKK